MQAMSSLLNFLPIVLASSLPLTLTAPTSTDASALVGRADMAPDPFLPGGWDNTAAGLLNFTNNKNWPIPANELDIGWCMHDGEVNVDTFLNYGVLIPDDSKYDTSGCGRGFLDNLRGRCGVITDWTCNYVGATETTAALSFETVNTCTEWDVSQAILAASYQALNIACNWAADGEYSAGGTTVPLGGFGGDGK